MNTTIETLKEMEFVTYVAAGSLIALVLMVGCTLWKSLQRTGPQSDRPRPMLFRREIV
jgi:hypothetical protein